MLESLYSSVRPYGGSLSLDPGVRELVAAANLTGAEIVENPSSLVVFRSGALPDSADWTHQYGDIANSVKSDDSRLKLPLGVLWFGGSSNMDVLPRHGHGPPEQVIGGRMFIEGINCLSARDVYTRRNEGVSIWVVEAQHIAASSPEEKGPLYEPSNSKVYRHPTFFDIPEEVGHM